MVFNSLNFLIFFLVVIIIFYNIPNKFKWVILLLSNFYFYMYFNPKYIVIVIFLAIVAYFCGIAIEKCTSIFIKKSFLAICILANIGTLFMFKYLHFFQSISKKLFKISPNINFQFLVPLGISFFTLQIISYIVDVYKGKIKAEKNFGFFLCYITFFTTITSGPIERADHFLPQLHKEIKFNYDNVVDGLKIFTWGLLKKVVIANRLSVYVDNIYNNTAVYKGWPLIIASIFYAFQLYCDFSGYTDMAIGFSKMLGFNINKNFNLPYFSKSVTEFWRRWHISLSSWLKDYIYIPLGGGKVNIVRVYINIIIVFLVSGLWHGAQYGFIVWGMLHAIYQIIEKIRDKIKIKLKIGSEYKKKTFYKIFAVVKTFLLVDFAWIFFRADSLRTSIYIIKNMFVNLSFNHTSIVGANPIAFYINIFIILMLIIAETFIYCGFVVKKQSVYVRWSIYYAGIFIIILLGSFGNGQFIYARF